MSCMDIFVSSTSITEALVLHTCYRRFDSNGKALFLILLEYVRFIWIKWTPFSSIRHTLIKWSNGIMLCIILCARVVSRMDQIDQINGSNGLHFLPFERFTHTGRYNPKMKQAYK